MLLTAAACSKHTFLAGAMISVRDLSNSTLLQDDELLDNSLLKS